MSIFLSQSSKAFKASSLSICLIGIFLSSFFLEISEYINESSKFLLYCEWWYNSTNCQYMGFSASDVNNVFDIVNQGTYQAIKASDFAFTPTIWQLSQFPSELKHCINVIEDGFPENVFNTKGIDNDTKTNELNLIYTARSLEYVRGVDRLKFVVSYCEQEKIKCRITIVADDRRVYDSAQARNEIESTIAYLKKHPLVTYYEQLNYQSYLNELKKADIHLYLSRPFVLSWSYIESTLSGSFIFSINNNATLEKTHSNHINFANIEQCCKSISYYSQPEILSKLRTKKKDQVVNNKALDELRRRHSLQNWAHRLYCEFINS